MEPVERFWREQEELEKKYKDILLEINKEFRRELRKVGVRKNVIPTKIILPKEYISRLRKYKLFNQTFQRKVFWVYRKKDDEVEGKWVRIQTYPNLGGVPIEEGERVKVVVKRIPRRKRPKKG